MITKENFQNLLKKLNFIQKDNIWIKEFKDFDCKLKVDFQKQELIYPKNLKVNDKTTSNFKANENFVVFECINRLLEKGYNPKHIEIEPKWSLGHSQKSGKADIGIKDNSGENLLIIECKTWGNEYNKALNITKFDGGQIFSYSANSGAKYISLYASDENANFEYFLIKLIDNIEYLENHKELKSYKKARNGEYGDIAKALFQVWSETYKQEPIKGLFEESVEAYNLEKTKFNINDLKVVKEEDISKIYHKFATILRQHNVSGRENAFDKLVNLFLCKVVDEKENSDELQFYWKGFAYDEPFLFQDRLQKLYKNGMDKFLNEKITYIDNSEIDRYFSHFDINSIKNKVKDAIKKLKFFTNNDFAFIDVHNERLFEKNFEVLLKISMLIQDIHLTNSEENQFLGDMFEGFLDQGIKQNEGQYFTPMPIVKFIISSLPNREYKRVIDYACGAGHFLNEYARGNKTSKIVGIEKEYRLSKVAKVSSFMYQSDIDIIYDDALRKDIPNGKFDLLISNPPYSVKGFLETLKEEDLEEFELIKRVDRKAFLTNNSIECFFIEKAYHILNDNGLASIIVPISILDKTNSKIFIHTREIILKYFDIKAIVKLPSKTFGKTGTTTIILYLKKRDTKEDISTKIRDVLDDIFNKNRFNLLEVFKYKELFYNFIEYMGYNIDGYIKFIKNRYDKKIFEHEIFKSYKDEFIKSLKPKDKKRGYRVLREEFIKNIKAKELDRVYFFILAKLNGDVTVILPPDKNSDIKKFLGYEWSSAKGSEGIKYISKVNINEDLEEEDKRTLSNIKSINSIQTPLYNPNNLDDNTKLNKILRDTLADKNFEVNDSLKSYVNIFNLIDMLDFKEIEFNRVISLNIKKEVKIKSNKWKIDNLKKYLTFNPSKKEISSLDENLEISFIPMEYISNNGYIKKYDIRKLKELKKGSYTYFREEDIIIAKITPSMENGKCAIAKKLKNGLALGSSEFHVLRVKEKNTLNYEYIFYLLNQKTIRDEAKKVMTGSSGHKRVPIEFYEKIKIPLPPIDIQEKIVNECKNIDNEVEKAKKENIELKEKIKNLFENLKNQSNKFVKLSNNKIFDIKIGKRVLNREISQNKNFGIPVYSANVYKIFGYTKKDILKDFSKPSILWGIDGDWMVNTIKKDTSFYPTDHCGVLRIKRENLIHYRYLAFILYIKGAEENFSRVKRASIEKIKKIKIEYPDNYKIQEEIISQIEELETKINKNREIINSAKDKKEKILKKYL